MKFQRSINLSCSRNYKYFYNSIICHRAYTLILKGGEYYDKLGSDIGTKSPKKSALTAFIDRSGWFLAWRLNFTRTTPKIGDCGAWSSPSIRPFNRYSGIGLGGPKIVNLRRSLRKIEPTYEKSARSMNKCGHSWLYSIFYLVP